MSELREWPYVPPPNGFWSGFWWFLDNKWPTERQWVTIWIILILLLMFTMAWLEPSLWKVERFNTILQAVTITGLINMVLAYHFSANQGQQLSSQNTQEALRLARETHAAASQGDPAKQRAEGAGEAAGAAADRAAELAEEAEETPRGP